MITQCRYIILAIAGLILWSCSTDKSDYTKLVAEWQGKEIVFPEIMTDAMTGDTINLADADFTILTYVDSIGCTSCKLRLPYWIDFIASLDTITEYDVNVIMIVNTSKEEDIKYLIKRDDYNHPVYIDFEDEANALNSFPTDYRFQTFLLDKSQKVIALGSPVYLPSIAKLFKLILSGKYTFNLESNQDVSISNNEFIAPNIEIGEKCHFEFKVINNGIDTVFIRKVLNSCECIDTKISNNFILPDDSMTVTVEMTADSIIGTFYRNTQIYYSGFDYPSVITIKGNIIENTSSYKN